MAEVRHPGRRCSVFAALVPLSEQKPTIRDEEYGRDGPRTKYSWQMYRPGSSNGYNDDWQLMAFIDQLMPGKLPTFSRAHLGPSVLRAEECSTDGVICIVDHGFLVHPTTVRPQQLLAYPSQSTKTNNQSSAAIGPRKIHSVDLHLV